MLRLCRRNIVGLGLFLFAVIAVLPSYVGRFDRAKCHYEKRDVREHEHKTDSTEQERPNFRLAIVAPPKPFHEAPAQYTALASWNSLRIKPDVYLVELENDLKEVEEVYGVKYLTVKLNHAGLPLQDSIFSAASKISNVDVVVVVNADIVLHDDFIDAIEECLLNFDRFLLVGARTDLENVQSPPTPDAQWLKSFKEYSQRKGVLHTYGGTDYYAWRPQGNPWKAAVGGRIPPFTYGRGKADNWIVQMALQNGVDVIDGSLVVVATHQKHGYHIEGEGNQQDQPTAFDLHSPDDVLESAHLKEENHPSYRNSSVYVNYWHAAPHDLVLFNKHLAFTYGDYRNQQGRTIDANWRLAQCTRRERKYLCIQQRLRPGTCACEQVPFTERTLSEPRVNGNRVICEGLSPVDSKDYLMPQFAFEQLVQQRAKDKTIIVFGINYGYHTMLMNMVCRMQALSIEHYVIAAFDYETYQFCRKEVLPCFIAYTDDENVVASAADFGTAGFRALTKIKSRQVLRILKLGYSVLWSDVDIFWKSDPLQEIISTSKGTESEPAFDIAVQSNAPAEEIDDNGHRRINSGFYFAKSTENVIDAFSAIVSHAKASRLSEQPSFYTILCGDAKEHAISGSACYNPKYSVRTHFLSRERFLNGAMPKWKDLTPSADFVVAHNNWITGYKAKKDRFIKHGMWFLDSSNECVDS